MRVSTSLAAAAITCALAAPAHAVALVHSGAADPVTEGFLSWHYGPSASGSAISNDQGRDAWQVAALGTDTQFGYIWGSYPAAQQSAFAGGFEISLVARLMQGTSASVYSSANPVVLASATLDGPTRYGIYLGLDANGDAVVVLPKSLDASGGGGRIRVTGGLSYTLTGLGNGYHTYDLVFGPLVAGTQTGTLYVDGTARLSGYTGYANAYGSNFGFGFYDVSGGVARFSHVQISAVPEPSNALMLLAGLMAVGPRAVRRAARRPSGE